MRILRRLIPALFALPVLFGCVNNYEKFYTGELSNIPNALVPSSANEVTVLNVAVNENTFREMIENGFVYKGHSGWTGPAQDQSFAKSHAANIGASHIILSSELLSTEMRNIPIVLPNTQTTYHSGSYSGYGSGYGGYSSGTYGGTSTTYGTQTTYIPIQNKTYESHAYYFVKTDTSKLKFGARILEVSSEMSSQLGVNGAVQLIVVKNTPAYNADFISGDVVVAFSGEKIRGPIDFSNKLMTSTGNETFKIFRNGKYINLNMDFSSN